MVGGNLTRFVDNHEDSKKLVLLLRLEFSKPTCPQRYNYTAKSTERRSHCRPWNPVDRIQFQCSSSHLGLNGSSLYRLEYRDRFAFNHRSDLRKSFLTPRGGNNYGRGENNYRHAVIIRKILIKKKNGDSEKRRDDTFQPPSVHTIHAQSSVK